MCARSMTTLSRPTAILFCTFLILVSSPLIHSSEIKPIIGSLDRKDVAGSSPSNVDSPNLRTILYPTYFSGNPFQNDKWQFHDGNTNEYLWNPANPMARYSDITNLLDRNLRSVDDYVLIEQARPELVQGRVNLDSQERPEFAVEQPGFLPFYSGHGRR